jgi:uncharacterized RDD family membrane protein YckC
MRARPVHRIVGGFLDALVLVGIGAGVGLLLRGATPSPLLLVVGRLLVAAYLLLRDAGGMSPGKRRMKLRVVAAGGAEATPGQRVLRNVTIAAAPISAGIPVAVQAAWLLVLLETVLVMSGRNRLGDLLAHTTVVSDAPAARKDAGPSGAGIRG